MKVISVAALVVAVIALGLSIFGVRAWDGLATDVETPMGYQVDGIEQEVEALGGWSGSFVMLEEGTLETDIAFGEVTAEGYQLFSVFGSRDAAERYVRSLANIERWGVMVLQPDSDRWMVYREFP